MITINEYVDILINARRYDIVNEKKLFGGLFNKKKKSQKEIPENKYEIDPEYKKAVDEDIRIIKSMLPKILKELNIQKYISIYNSGEVEFLEDNGKYYICYNIYRIDGYEYCNDNNLNVREDWEEFEPIFDKWADQISSMIRNSGKVYKFKHIKLELGGDWDSWAYSIYFNQ